MTSEIILTLSILGVAMLLFITEWLSADLVALLTLSVLAISGLVTPEEALSGFSSSAVVTVWAVFILSAGLARTGVAAWLGRQVMRLGGSGEARMLLVIMLAAAFLSAFMNNVGVTALLLPVVLDISRRTKLAPSRLLLPLAFSSLLGGMSTLIGTPPNILVSNVLQDFGYQPFTLFDFAPFGLVVTAVGILYLVTVGRMLLPKRDMAQEFHENDRDMTEAFAIEDRLFVMALPPGSLLEGRTLGESRLGSVLGLNVIGVMRKGHTNLAPTPEMVLHAGDKLLVTGRADTLLTWNQTAQFEILSQNISIDALTSEKVALFEGSLPAGSALAGKTLEQVGFRQRYGATVLAAMRQGQPIHYRMESLILQPDDRLLLQVSNGNAAALTNSPDIHLKPTDGKAYHLEKALTLLMIPTESSLCNQTISESHLGDAYRLSVFGIIRGNETLLMPQPEEPILPGDKLLVKVRPESITTLQALHGLQVDTVTRPKYTDIESEQIGLLEAALSPQSSLPGKTLREAHFREKYGLSVLAIWRSGTTKRTGLRDMRLRLGDALLVFGPRPKLQLLAADPDFLPLTEADQPPPRLKKAPMAALMMLGMVLVVGLGWLPISLAAISAAALMLLCGCLTMNQAYRAIEWKAIFLIAGMLPLGIAMQTSGTAQFIADQVMALVQPYGTQALVAGIFLLTLFASQVMPSAVVSVLMAPIAISTAQAQGLSPFALVMVVAVATSACFLVPISHPSNILIMGPGGYKFKDYFKAGLPLALVILALVVFVLPVIWPL